MREGDYNAALAASDKERYALMDAKNIPYGGGQSKIELCDVLSEDGRFIHIKKYSGSAVLRSSSCSNAECLLTYILPCPLQT